VLFQQRADHDLRASGMAHTLTVYAVQDAHKRNLPGFGIGYDRRELAALTWPSPC
jgi:hypothetical protein